MLAAGGTHGCDGQLGRGLAEDRFHSSHFALEAEPRQDAALGPSPVCPGRGTPQRGAASWPWCGLGDDHEDQQPRCCLGALQPTSWLWLGAKAWAGSILPSCLQLRADGSGITHLCQDTAGQRWRRPPATCIPRCPCLLPFFIPSIGLGFLQALYTPFLLGCPGRSSSATQMCSHRLSVPPPSSVSPCAGSDPGFLCLEKH